MKNTDVYTALLGLGFKDSDDKNSIWSVRKGGTTVSFMKDHAYCLTSKVKYTSDTILHNIPGYMGESK